VIEKEAIVAEYLRVEENIRALGIKYGVDFRTVYSWVSQYPGAPLKKTKPQVWDDQTLNYSSKIVNFFQDETLAM
jgi:transposase-like protein